MDNYWTRLERARLARRSVLRGMGIAGAGAAAFALAGCGDDDSGKTPATPATGGTKPPASASAAGTTAPAASPTPQSFLASIPIDPPDPTPVAQYKAGGTIVRMTERPFGFDFFAPGASNNVYETVVPVYSRLLRFSNRANMKSVYNPDLEGDLASSWEQPDDTTLVFQLRPDIKWQNVAPLNGRPLTVDDIKYWLNRGQNHMKNTAKTDWLRIAAVDDVGGGKIRLKLAKPYQPMLQIIAGPIFSVMPPEIGGTDLSTLATSAVGTGPFIVTKSTPNVEVVYKKNPDYYLKDSAGKQLPYLDGFSFSFIADPATRLASLEAGKADSAYNTSSPLTFDNVESFASRTQGKYIYQLMAQTAPNFYFQGHYAKAPWSDPRVRRALSMLFDRATVIKTVHKGYSQIGPYFPWTAAFDKEPKLDDLGPNYKFDPATAKQLLSAAGVAPGTEFQLDWYDSSQNEAFATLFEQSVQQGGIKLKLNKNADVVAHFAKLQKKDWPDLIFVGRGINFQDAEAVAGGFQPGNGVNYAEVNDSEMNKLYDQIQTAKGNDRRAVSKQMWDRLIDQMFEVGMPKQYDLTWWSTRLHNWRNTASYGNFGNSSPDQIWVSS